MNKKIIFLKGLPASGKSTWAKAYCEENSNTIRLNKDDIRKEFGIPTWSQEFEKQVLAIQRERGILALRSGSSIIIDDTNFAKIHYNFWKNIALQYQIEFEEQYFELSVEDCIARDLGREKPVGEAVIRSMWKEYVKTDHSSYDHRIMLIQDESLPHCVICDLDGTLALHSGRSPFDKTLIHTDRENEQIKNLLNYFHSFGVEIIYVSGRSDDSYQETMDWLKATNSWYREDQKLIMRKSGDFRADNIIKAEIYEKHFKEKYFVDCIFEDRDKVVKLWRSLGLLCLQVYYGDF